MAIIHLQHIAEMSL